MKEIDKHPVSTRDRWQLWFLILAVVVVASMRGGPYRIVSVLYFPIGLLGWLLKGDDKAIGAVMLGYPLLLGWGFYILLSVILFRARRNWIFFLLCAFLCMVLLLNVAGCNECLIP